MTPEVSILVPHYKTPALVKRCLELLQQHTPPGLAQIIVIDNNSQDESVDYLRKLSYIEFIERETIAGELPHQSHARALDVGLTRVTTPYVLSIHTDTLVKHNDWLFYLLKYIKSNPNIAGVGSWKLEILSRHKRILKFIERHLQLAYYFLIHKKNHNIEGAGKNYFYLRSHCALYRTDLLKKYALSFSEGLEPAGKILHKKLIEKGHEMVFLDAAELRQYLDHINHATMVLNPELGAKQKTIRRGKMRLKNYI